MPVTEEMVLDALRPVRDPDLNRSIVDLGFVKDIKICGGNVAFTLELTTPACPVRDILQQEAHDAVMALPEVESVNVGLSAKVIDGRTADHELVPDVKHVIAVASGKGGVGKSTVSCNLAISLAETGASVGLVDLDVYGPSIPRMMGCHEEQPRVFEHKLVPIVAHGVRLMSIGFMMRDEQAGIWRGPIVAGTVRQLFGEVEWGELDYLIADLPPGTGDAPMSAAQLVPLSGVVIVMTPQEVAARIASKSITMFRKMNSPIIGVIENMAGFVCPNCGVESQVFPGPGGRELARQFQAPFLGSIPLDPLVGESSDKGLPSVLAYPDRPQAHAFRKIAGQLAAQVTILHMIGEPVPESSAASD
ncbi:MAG: Mrp/NBP35 family ATP-binding protein [Fimbriimonadia bacterium]|jgi:ATP-binding protein involved in chromosome partitioning